MSSWQQNVVSMGFDNLAIVSDGQHEDLVTEMQSKEQTVKRDKFNKKYKQGAWQKIIGVEIKKKESPCVQIISSSIDRSAG